MPNKEPYKMYPGKHSEVNPGNFKGSEMMKYKAFLYNNPQSHHDKEGKKKKIDNVIQEAIKGDNPNIRTIGDPKQLLKDRQTIDSTLVANKNRKMELLNKSKQSSKDKIKNLRDEYKDFFNQNV